MELFWRRRTRNVIIDWRWRALHLGVGAGKQVVVQDYGKPADKSSYKGYSAASDLRRLWILSQRSYPEGVVILTIAQISQNYYLYFILNDTTWDPTILNYSIIEMGGESPVNLNLNIGDYYRLSTTWNTTLCPLMLFLLRLERLRCKRLWWSVVSAIVTRLEDGGAPDYVIAAYYQNNNQFQGTGFTRPLCKVGAAQPLNFVISFIQWLEP
ncbi:hypothetical protein NEOLEDRAFT_1150714 [Neolentinus lepideus HHB14362 ss-1]|uniref:Uncharacterized protein n=1 Tax=Neolentinus lepideus HHB14362 ss-1 TaxID=1314782 RepID=A0A165PRG7_9AGAM|nr:hypothetical protein NEOLEDRAFT_1150714 [Neolentinus lepideus HHB14362 ss-1]